MFQAGDVVLGGFATQSGDVIHHYSVVLIGNDEGALVVYTTSLKEECHAEQVFTREDMLLANWKTPCRWDASQAALVPSQCLRKVGRISQPTLQRIMLRYQQALRQKTLVVTQLNENRDVVPIRELGPCQRSYGTERVWH